MVFYYPLTFPHLQPAHLHPRNLSKSQERGKLKPAEKANQQDLAILHQDPIQAQPVEDVLTTEISCTSDHEEAAIITPEILSSM